MRPDTNPVEPAPSAPDHTRLDRPVLIAIPEAGFPATPDRGFRTRDLAMERHTREHGLADLRGCVLPEMVQDASRFLETDGFPGGLPEMVPGLQPLAKHDHV